jgi:hypothetical protein
MFNGKNPYTETYSMYRIHVNYFPEVLKNFLMMASAGLNM